MSSPAPLVDTNVVSELARPRPNAGVVRWAESTSAIALSVITVEELFFGLAWRPNPRVASWLSRFLDERCEVLGVTASVARRAGELRGHRMARGAPHTQADMLIAATAEIHQRTLVTRNTRDFREIAIPLLDPFS
jgi:toxin FitB